MLEVKVSGVYAGRRDQRAQHAGDGIGRQVGGTQQGIFGLADKITHSCSTPWQPAAVLQAAQNGGVRLSACVGEPRSGRRDQARR